VITSNQDEKKEVEPGRDEQDEFDELLKERITKFWALGLKSNKFIL